MNFPPSILVTPEVSKEAVAAPAKKTKNPSRFRNIVQQSFGIKLGLLITLLITLITGLSLGYVYVHTKKILIDQIRVQLTEIGHVGAIFIDDNEIEFIENFKKILLENENFNRSDYVGMESEESKESLTKEDSDYLHKTPEFQALVQTLRKIQYGTSTNIMPMDFYPQHTGEGANPPSIVWAYLVVKDERFLDKDMFMFIADSNYDAIDGNHDGIQQSNEFGNPIGNLYYPSKDIYIQAWNTGNPISSDNWYTDKWGTFMTSLVPIKNHSGEVIALLGVDYGAQNPSNKLNILFIICSTMFIAALLISIMVSSVLASFISIPLKKLSYGADKIRQRNFNFKIKSSGKDEFSVLTSSDFP